MRLCVASIEQYWALVPEEVESVDDEALESERSLQEYYLGLNFGVCEIVRWDLERMREGRV